MSRMGFNATGSCFSKSLGKGSYLPYKGPRPLPTPQEARGIFGELDADQSGSVSREELIEWIKSSGMLHGLDDEDAVTQATHVFNEMDKDNNGTLDFDEFYEYLKLIETEQENIAWASRHYITSLPPALPSSIESEFSFDALRRKLHRKIEQFTSQDTDRLRQTIRLFRNQTIRSKRADEAASEMRINKREFFQVISWLGMFASKAQADKLFDMYDVNGDGDLTVHEFLTRARPADYPRHGRSQHNPTTKHYHPMKRSFHKPTTQISFARKFHSTTALSESLKAKMQEYAREGQYNEGQAKEDLVRAFETMDEFQRGYVSESEMIDVFEMLEVKVSQIQVDRLMTQFGQRQGKIRAFHYSDFVEHLYAQKHNAVNPHNYRLSARTMTYDATTRNGTAVSTYQAQMRPFGNSNLNLDSDIQGPFKNGTTRRPGSATRNYTDDRIYESFRMDGSTSFSRPVSSLSQTRNSGRQIASRGSSRGRPLSRSASQPTFNGMRLRTPRLEDLNPQAAEQLANPVPQPYY